ncbi:MAG: SDR family NAD(P)-dependent oxidoreductase [Polyangiales bacterium]
MGLWDSLLDRSIFFAFDASGFERHAKHFTPLNASLEGQRFVVTGANSGLGLATTRSLAARGAEVWMLCRSEKRGRAARDLVRRESGNDAIHLALVDMSSLASVDAFLSSFEERPVHALVHNAGVLLDERDRTDEGFELTYATNILGSFRLTHGLRASLAPGARVVFVASGGMYSTALDLDGLRRPAEPFDGVEAYAQTKRAQVELARVMAAELPELHISAMHPGWADTPGVSSSLPGFYARMKNRLRTPAQGADTILWLATSAEAKETRGRFYFDREPAETTLWFRRETSDAERRRLWQQLMNDAGIQAFGETP